MVSKKTVLVLTQQLDFHADLVIHELNRRGVNLVRFDTSDFPQRSTLIARSRSGSWDGAITLQDRSIHFDQLSSIVMEAVSSWYRSPAKQRAEQRT